MKRFDYLKLCVLNKVTYYTDWWFGVFCLSKTDHTEPKYDYEPFLFDWGYGFYDPTTKELVRIEDASAKEPLFNHTERITIDQSWATNLKQPKAEVSIGNIVGNSLCLEYAFGNKFPMPLGPISIRDIEEIIVASLADTPGPNEVRKDNLYYVDEYINFCDSIQTLKIFASIFSVSATTKNIAPPTGADAFKKELDKKYGDTIADPIVLAKYEAELKNFDAEYLKDDPSYKKLMSGKITNIARKKLHLTMGQESLRFDDSKLSPTISTSLSEGWPDPNDQPEKYTAMMNSMRIGSFARGAETVKGGVSAKNMAIDYLVTDSDCGVGFGVSRVYTKENIHLLRNTYVVGNKPTLVTKETEGQYLGKVVEKRSPYYCKQQGDAICRVCAGELLFNFKNGMAIPLMDMSAIILAASMAAMHGKVLSVAEIDIGRDLL